MRSQPGYAEDNSSDSSAAAADTREPMCIRFSSLFLYSGAAHPSAAVTSPLVFTAEEVPQIPSSTSSKLSALPFAATRSRASSERVSRLRTSGSSSWRYTVLLSRGIAANRTREREPVWRSIVRPGSNWSRTGRSDSARATIITRFPALRATKTDSPISSLSRRRIGCASSARGALAALAASANTNTKSVTRYCASPVLSSSPVSRSAETCRYVVERLKPLLSESAWIVHLGVVELNRRRSSRSLLPVSALEARVLGPDEGFFRCMTLTLSIVENVRAENWGTRQCSTH